MSNIDYPPPSYQAATGIPPKTTQEPSSFQQPAQTQYDGNNVYTVPSYPQQQLQPVYNQHYYPPPVVIQQTDFETHQKRIKRRKCICATLTVVFFVVIILKFVLFAVVRGI